MGELTWNSSGYCAKHTDILLLWWSVGGMERERERAKEKKKKTSGKNDVYEGPRTNPNCGEPCRSPRTPRIASWVSPVYPLFPLYPLIPPSPLRVCGIIATGRCCLSGFYFPISLSECRKTKSSLAAGLAGYLPGATELSKTQATWSFTKDTGNNQAKAIYDCIQWVNSYTWSST